MKKNPILLAMLVVLLALSMALVACDNGGGGDPNPNPNPNPNPSPSSSLQWPTGFTYADGNTVGGKVDRIGTWTATGIGNLVFHESSGSPWVSIGSTGGSMPDLVKVEGKKITVKPYGGSDILLCTEYTLDETAGTLTLTGGDVDSFEDYLDVALTKN